LLVSAINYTLLSNSATQVKNEPSQIPQFNFVRFVQCHCSIFSSFPPHPCPLFAPTAALVTFGNAEKFQHALRLFEKMRNAALLFGGQSCGIMLLSSTMA
jgi:hypothetical protein